MNEVFIKRLSKNDIEEINEVSSMLYNWWGKEEGLTKEAMSDLIETRCGEKEIPIIYIAKHNDEVVGTISLIINDMDFKQDIYPLIVSFFIKEEYRNKGIARQLINRLIKQCKGKFNQIYLATDLESFYEKFGFEYIETCKCYYNIKLQKIDYYRIYKKELEKTD